jgi:hypothetical protein
MIHLPFCSRTIQKQLEKRMTQYLHWKFDIESEFVGKRMPSWLQMKQKKTWGKVEADYFVDLKFSAFKWPTICPDGSKNLHW